MIGHYKYNKEHNKDAAFCICKCHKEGEDIKHIMPCCSLTNKKYIDKNDILDLNQLIELLNSKK